MSGVVASRVRTSRLQIKARDGDSLETAAGCFSHLPISCDKEGRSSLSLKTSLASSTATGGRISETSLRRWMSSGMSAHGEFWMRSTSERLKDGAVSSLWQAMEMQAPLRYFLTPEQLKKFLTRIRVKGDPFPENMEKAMKAQITYLSSMGASEGNRTRARKARAGGQTARRGRSTHAVARMLYARRLLPSECEILQGFPKGWTETGTGR